MIDCRLHEAKKILCLGAHSDDIEIGCGGTILKLIRQQPELELLWFVLSADEKRRHEAENSAKDFLSGSRASEIVFGGFRESYFPDQWAAIKDAIERVKTKYDPDIVFTHLRSDRHQDHRTISDLTWNAYRNHLILEYEVPKYDGDLGQPNVFVPLSAELCNKKADLIPKHFLSQAPKHWFRKDTFMSLLRLRGIECAAGYAEAFYCRKMIL
jgi:LmbE family N-acetylglucosaminyl deacetylase